MYTYQILPNTSNIQFNVANEYDSIEELVRRKNEFFQKEIISHNLKYRGKGYSVLNKVEYNEGYEMVIRFGVKKSISITDKEFEEKNVDTYPNILVYINNHPQKQKIFIQENLEAFTSTDVVANIIENAAEKALKMYDLSIYIEKNSNPEGFWKTVNRYHGSIKRIKFVFIKPNMSNISGDIVRDIKIMKSDLNGHEIDLSIKAPKDGVLQNIDEDNKDIQSMVEYWAEGGGPAPSIAVKGIRREIKTDESQKVEEIDEIHVKNGNFKEIASFLSKFFKGNE